MQFNLLNEPWVAVLCKDGSYAEVSLLDLFRHAHMYESFAGDSKAQDVAMMRFCLGILHRVFSQVNAQGIPYKQTSVDDVLNVWKGLYDMGHFPDVVTDYLIKWQDRFDLYDEKHPFYQVPADFFLMDMKKAEEKKLSVTALDANIAKSGNVNKLKVCATRSFGDDAVLSHAEAARWLIYRQTFDLASGKGYWKDSKTVKAERGGGADVSAFFLSFGAKLGHLVVHGSSLWETLLLNFAMLNNGETLFDYDPVCHTRTDLPGSPFWEWDQVVTVDDENVMRQQPTSPVALLCLRSRLVHLIPESDGVRYFWSTYGDYVTWQDNMTEQNSLFKLVKSKDKPMTRLPQSVSSRFFENFSGVVAADTSGLIGWLRCLQSVGYLPKDRALLFSGLSLEVGDMNSAIKDVHFGEMSFSSVLLQQTLGLACIRISEELKLMDDIRFLMGRLAVNFLTCKVRTQAGKSKIGQADGVSRIAKDTYGDAAERVILDWLKDLSEDDVTVHLETSCGCLRKQLIGLARRMGDSMFASLPDFSGRVDGDTVHVPEKYLRFFHRDLSKLEIGKKSASQKGKGSAV